MIKIKNILGSFYIDERPSKMEELRTRDRLKVKNKEGKEVTLFGDTLFKSKFYVIN